MPIYRKNNDRSVITSTSEYTNKRQRDYDYVGNSMRNQPQNNSTSGIFDIGRSVVEHNIVAEISEENFWPIDYVFGSVSEQEETKKWFVSTDDKEINAATSNYFRLSPGESVVIQTFGAKEMPGYVYIIKEQQAIPVVVFEDYHFFTAEEEGLYCIKLPGITGPLSEVYRSTPTSRTYVYVFISDDAWEVDINGTIINKKSYAIYR